MQLPINVLLASHNSAGAQAAEDFTLSRCPKQAHILHLYVIPEFWQTMLGDDWRNNPKTRQQFSTYLDQILTTEAQAHQQQLRQKADAHDLQLNTLVKTGKPLDCLLQSLQEHPQIEMVVLGSARPWHLGGLRSRMLTKKLWHACPVPLLVVPFPRG